MLGRLVEAYGDREPDDARLLRAGDGRRTASMGCARDRVGARSGGRARRSWYVARRSGAGSWPPPPPLNDEGACAVAACTVAVATVAGALIERRCVGREEEAGTCVVAGSDTGMCVADVGRSGWGRPGVMRSRGEAACTERERRGGGVGGALSSTTLFGGDDVSVHGRRRGVAWTMATRDRVRFEGVSSERDAAACKGPGRAESGASSSVSSYAWRRVWYSARESDVARDGDVCVCASSRSGDEGGEVVGANDAAFVACDGVRDT